MAKRYDINSISGTEFTYQLYANLAAQVNGESAVEANLTAREPIPGNFMASFTISGGGVEGQDFKQVFYSPSYPSPGGGLFQVRVVTSGGVEITSFENLQPLGDSFNYLPFLQDGDYEIYQLSTEYQVYKNSILIGHFSVSTQDEYPTSSTFVDNGAMGGTITNIVLGP